MITWFLSVLFALLATWADTPADAPPPVPPAVVAPAPPRIPAEDVRPAVPAPAPPPTVLALPPVEEVQEQLPEETWGRAID